MKRENVSSMIISLSVVVFLLLCMVLVLFGMLTGNPENVLSATVFLAGIIALMWVVFDALY